MPVPRLRTLAVAALTGFLATTPVLATPMISSPSTPPRTGITLVYGGCGPYGHRGPYGYCRPGGQAGYVVHRACPWGWHLGPYGHHCFRN